MQLKQKYSIKKSLLRLLPFLMLAGTPSCKKQPLPEPEPYDVVIDWNWEDNLGWAPPVNLIKKYAQDKYVNNIFINLTSPNSGGMAVQSFRRARDSLQTRIDVAPTRVRGMGTIYPWRANVPDDDPPYTTGMYTADSLWYNEHGWTTKSFLYGR